VTRWVTSQESAEHPKVRKEEGKKAIDNEDHALVADEKTPTEFALMANIENKRSDKVKEGVGYNDVPPLATDLYLSPKKDLSWTGLPKFVDDTVTDYSRPSPTVVGTSAEDQNKDTSTSEDVASPNPPKPFVKFLKPKDSQPESKSKEQKHLRNHKSNMLNNTGIQIRDLKETKG
nr:hypothetical protein [Tanacetum cinerariifolium]